MGGASRPPEVPLTGCVRGEERGGEGVVVASRGPPWSLRGSPAKLVAAVADGWRLCVWRREKWGSRGERESSVSERERGGRGFGFGSQAREPPPPFVSFFLPFFLA